MNTEGFHKLEDDVIRFRAMEMEDAKTIHEYASNPDVKKFIGWPLSITMEDTNELVSGMIGKEAAGTHLYATVIAKDTDQIVGTVMVFNFNKEANHAEVGYVFHHEYWNKGYGTRSIALIDKFVFTELGLHKLNARVTDVNIGSKRILEKNGYTHEGLQKDQDFVDGKYYDLALLAKFA